MKKPNSLSSDTHRASRKLWIPLVLGLLLPSFAPAQDGARRRATRPRPRRSLPKSSHIPLYRALEVVSRRFPQEISRGYAFEGGTSGMSLRSTYLPQPGALEDVLESLSVQSTYRVEVRNQRLVVTHTPASTQGWKAAPPSSDEIRRLTAVQISEAPKPQRWISLHAFLDPWLREAGLVLCAELYDLGRHVRLQPKAMNLLQLLEALRREGHGEFWIQGNQLRLDPASRFRWNPEPEFLPEVFRKIRKIPQEDPSRPIQARSSEGPWAEVFEALYGPRKPTPSRGSNRSWFY